MGYAGGTSKNPTYHNLDGHTESIQLDFDPNKVTFQELLDIFWQSHDPFVQVPYRQYMSIIFYHDKEQKRLALESKKRLEDQKKRRIYTEIRPADHFTLAEGYHQKFYLSKAPDILQEFRMIYPKLRDFVDSTAAARVNGYLGGNGDAVSLRQDLPGLGLSPRAQKRLWNIAQGFNPTGEACPIPGV